MKYLMVDHHDKGYKFSASLNEAGHERRFIKVPNIYPKTDFILTDSDASTSKANMLEKVRERGARHCFVYPHAGRPNLYNDIYPAWEHTTAQLVSSEGHIEVMRAYGYNKPIEVVGWALSEIKPFEPTINQNEVLRVLFAPIHPRNADIDKKVNRDTFEILLKLHRRREIDLTVRHIGALPDNGLPTLRADDDKDYPIHYRIGALASSDTVDMDTADVVVAHQTYAYIAVARGIPTVMMAEDMPAHGVAGGGRHFNVRSWDKYSDLIRYPFDILKASDPLFLLEYAASTDAEIDDWRKRMIGQPFSPNRFIDIIDGYTGAKHAETISQETVEYPADVVWSVASRDRLSKVQRQTLL